MTDLIRIEVLLVTFRTTFAEFSDLLGGLPPNLADYVRPNLGPVRASPVDGLPQIIIYARNFGHLGSMATLRAGIRRKNQSIEYSPVTTIEVGFEMIAPEAYMTPSAAQVTKGLEPTTPE